MKWLQRVLASILGLVTAALLGAVYVLHSQHGLEWSYRLAAALLPGELVIERLEGRLSSPFSLSGIHYQDAAMELRIDQLALQWRPGELLDNTLQIDNLTIMGLHIKQTTSAAATPALPDISLPMTIHIDRATVNALSLEGHGGGKPFVLTEAGVTNVGFKKDTLLFEQIAVSTPAYQMTLSGRVTPRQDYPMDIRTQWSADGGEYGRLAGQGQVSGDLRTLKIRQQLTAPLRAEVHGTVTNPLSTLGWQAEVTAPKIDLHAMRAQWPPLVLSGTVRGKGDLLRIEADGELRSRYQDLRAEHRFSLAYNERTITLKRLETRLAKNGATVELHGTLSLGEQPQAALEGAWQGLRWPLLGEPDINSKAGRYTVAGSLEHYRLHVDGDLAGKNLPAGTWSINGEGTPQQMTINQVTGRVLGGTLGAKGKIVLSPQLKWDAAISGSDLNPGAQWTDWPGSIAFRAQSSGAISDGAAHLQVELSNLQGHVKSLPIEADGVLTVAGDRFDLNSLRINSGGNRFTAFGTLQDTWDVHWRVTAANLSQIFSPRPGPLAQGEGQGVGLGQQPSAESQPTDAGRLQGSGEVSGPRASPLFTASLAGQHLNVADYYVGEVELVLVADILGRVPSVIELQARDVSLGKFQLDSLGLHGNGTPQDHQALLSVTAPLGSVALKLAGGYQQQRWTGTLNALDVDALLAGQWGLAAPAQAALEPSAAHLDELCLQQRDARLCVAAAWAKQAGWQAQATARAVPLSMIKEWMPSYTPLTGDVEADVHVGADPGGLVTGIVHSHIRAGMIPPSLPGKPDTAPIAYHEGRLTLSLNEQALIAQIEAALADGGSIVGNLDIARHAIPAPLGEGHTTDDTALRGRLQGEVKDLSLLPALIPGVEHTQGRLYTTVTVSGAWEKPRLIGEARLENGSAAIPALGINPEGINLVARGDEQGRLRFDGQLRSKDGTLRVGGNVQYDGARGLNIQAQLDGDRAEIANTPEFHILASPSMRLKVQGRRIDLDGEIFIPEANLRPRDISGAVSASDDVVILNAEDPTTREPRWQIYSQLRIRLGNLVKFSGFGLKGLLVGDISLSDSPQQPTTASGELRINNGEYRAYGQKLAVDRGRLLFFGGAVDNPGLDIRAVRHIEEVTAGIQVRGTLKAPQVQLFSEPAMAESDALSYLLIGHPISQATASQGQQLYGAALSLGLAGSGLLANQIGQRFGIDEVLVESGGSFGGGALVIRHYLSPKLYISYGVGLVERFNVFLMRYQLSRRWALEAESGIQSGADVVYTLERN